MIQTGITFHQPGFETDGNSRVSIKPGKEKKDGKFRANLGKSSGSDPDVRRGQTTSGEVRRQRRSPEELGKEEKVSIFSPFFLLVF